MKLGSTHIIVGMILILFAYSCQTETQQKVPVLNFEDFEYLLHQNNDTVYIVNFWATWCKPCINELPDFENINRDFKSQKVKVILVSLDFPKKHAELLLPFIHKHQLKSQIIHLADTDANSWIDKVSPGWSGAIPATMIYKGAERTFYERIMTYEELKLIVEQKL